MSKIKTTLLTALLLGLYVFFAPAYALEPGYPPEWWQVVDPSLAESWEVLPQSAGAGEVILSKRTELGIFSNFAATPILLDGATYASVEGFWQMMKYPDGQMPADPRSNFEWTRDRLFVGNLSGIEAKRAGDAGSAVMRTLGINWVSFAGRRLPYRVLERGGHYDLILRAMRAKLSQTTGLADLLLSTEELLLIPDHDQGANPPPAWRYHQIWSDLRTELRDSHKSTRRP